MHKKNRFADVYVGYPIDGSYTYKIPENMEIDQGIRVQVNFNGKIITAFVHQIHSIKPDLFEPKDIIKAIDEKPIFDSRLVELSKYTSNNYICSIGEVMAMAIPSGKRASKRFKIPFQKEESTERSLTEKQKIIYDDILSSYRDNRLFHLIFGITGSGKTQVYIDIAKNIIKQGRSVIYLVPEISLSSQIFKWLYNVFGNELILYHSHLTQNQRLYNWMRFYSGDAKIAVGTRSAVFLQCPDLGFIVIDEEHDGSYKEHSTPRYHARRLAYYRCRKENAILLLGSATPSIESLYTTEKGIFKLHTLKERYGNASLPDIEIVKIFHKKGSEMLSPKLKLFSKRAMDNGNQIIYLLNRRGFSPIVICNSCGDVAGCPHCNVSLNFHMDGALQCHYCGYKRKLSNQCLKCGSEDILKLNAGTQRVEDIIKKTFRNSRVFRLDQDSARKKNTIVELITKMNNGDIDILLGTQMVAKGFNFLNVSVVGILLADIGLNLPDFRSPEKLFSLLIQVAGRCGRGNIKGRVIVQTLNENHYLFSFLKNHDYFNFYKHELSIRKMMHYPPYSSIIRLLIRGKKEERVITAIHNLKDEIEKKIKGKGSTINILGPSSAPLAKIANNYRYHMILKSTDKEELLKITKSIKYNVSGRDIYLEIDVDPYNML